MFRSRCRLEVRLPLIHSFSTDTDWAVLSLSQGFSYLLFIGTDFSDGTLRNKIVAYASFYNMLTMLLKDKTFHTFDMINRSFRSTAFS